MATPKKHKTTVEEVEKPVDLSADTIDKLTEVAEQVTGAVDPGTERRAGDLASAAKAADDLTTVSTIETISTPHAQAEDSLVAEGQRATSMKWETTQSWIALSVTWSALFVSAVLAVSGADAAQTAAFVFLYGVANLVIGFYFGRTNHQKIGGVPQGR